MNKIKVDTIKKITDIFFDKMRQKNMIYFQFDDDLYWNVPEDKFTNMSEQPELLVGSMNDDIRFLNSLVEENYDANYLELERLSSIFKYLSFQLAP